MQKAPNSLKIRPATNSDIKILAELSARTFVSAYQGLLPNDALENYVLSAFTQDKIGLEMSIAGNQFLLAFEAERPVGYALLGEAGPPVGLTEGFPLELARLYLDDKATGRGYGSALMRACFGYALESGHDAIWLGVWDRNLRAIRFYEKMGFVQVGSLPFVFGDQLHTDLVMFRSLSKD